MATMEMSGSPSHNYSLSTLHKGGIAVATTISGWPVLDSPAWGDSRAKRATIKGLDLTLWTHKEVWPLFAALVRDYNDTINTVTVCDGYDYRTARTSSSWSNHAGGVAVDINYNAEGARGLGWTNWWKTNKRNLQAQRLRKMYQVLNWGAWSGIADDPHTPQTEGWNPDYADAMHWELKAGTTVEDVRRVIEFLGITKDGYRMNDAKGRPRKVPPK